MSASVRTVARVTGYQLRDVLRSGFVDLLDAAERALPALTPAALADTAPAMRPVP